MDHPDAPLKGISLMIIAVFLIVVMNMFAKMVSDDLTAIEIVFYRNLEGLIIVMAIIIGMRRVDLFKTKRLKGQLLRGTAGTVGLGLVFWAYSLMPMAEVTAIKFVGGLSTVFLSALFLKEKVGIYRWGAVIVGLVGALVIVSPEGTTITTKGAIVAFAAAFIGGGVVAVMLRSLGKTDHAITTVFYFMAIGSILTAPYVFLYGAPVTSDHYTPLLLCGGVGVASLFLKTQAYRHAEASLLSPIHYTAIIWATLFGWIIWSDWPTWNVFVGAGIIITANLVIIWREHIKSKA